MSTKIEAESLSETIKKVDFLLYSEGDTLGAHKSHYFTHTKHYKKSIE